MAQSMNGCVMVPHAYGLNATVSRIQRVPSPSVSGAKSGVLRRRERAVEAVPAFEHRGGAGETALREQRRADARLRRSTGMQPLGRAAVGEILDDARRQAAGDADGLRDLGRRKAERGGDADGCRGRAENRGRMKARFVRSLGRDEAHAAHDLDAGGDAFDDGVAGEAAMLGRREHGRNDDRAGVHRPAFEGVVVILAVRRGAVDERGVVGTEAAVVPDCRGGSWRTQRSRGAAAT